MITYSLIGYNLIGQKVLYSSTGELVAEHLPNVYIELTEKEKKDLLVSIPWLAKAIERARRKTLEVTPPTRNLFTKGAS